MINRRLHGINRCITLLALLAGALSLPAPLMAEAKLLMTDTVFNFGLAPQDARLSRIFWLKSVGDDTLEIFKVIPGCGCTRAPLEKNRIAPGDSARLEIIFNSGKYTGRVVKHPQIQIVSQFMPQLLKIEATIVANSKDLSPLRLAPQRLDISQIGERVVSEAGFRIVNVSDDDLSLEMLETARGFLDTHLPARIAAGDSVELRMRIAPESLKNSFEKSITFSATPAAGGEKTVYSMPVTRRYRVYQDEKGKTLEESRMGSRH
ncbi:MAG: DUF1573 domain-containing protein [Candidatus Zixiibacteriota bacterium]